MICINGYKSCLTIKDCLTIKIIANEKDLLNKFRSVFL